MENVKRKKRTPTRGYMNAIAYLREKNAQGKQFVKYHGIKNEPARIETFEAMLKGKFPTVQHVRYFCQLTRNELFKRFISP
jgi:hypothetical protein